VKHAFIGSPRKAPLCGGPFVIKKEAACAASVVWSQSSTPALISLGPKDLIQDTVEDRFVRSITTAAVESVIIALLKPPLKVVLILAPAHMAVISDVGGAIDTVSSPIVSVSAAAIFLARLKSLTIAFMYGLTQNLGAAAVGVVISSARLYPPAIPLLGV